MKAYIRTLTLIGGLAFATGLASAQEISYLQSFPNDQPETLFTPNEYDWESYFSNQAVRVPGNRITYLIGSQPRENVNAPTPYGDNLERGYWLILDNTDQLAYTEIAVERDPDLQMSFQARHDSADADWHFAIRTVDGSWYVSEESFSGQSSTWQRFGINAGGDSRWIPLVFEVGAAMQISGEQPVTMDSIPGTINAVGFYGAVRVGEETRFRIDNFTLGTGLFTDSFPYRQGWSNNTYNPDSQTGSQFTPNTYEWESYFNSASIGYVARVPGNRITFLMGSRPMPNINAVAPHGDNLDRGYWLMAVNVDQLAYAEIAVPRHEDLHIGFDVRNDSIDANWHIALRFGADNWYVSADSYSGNTEEWEEFVYPSGPDSLWIPLFFMAGEYMFITEETPQPLHSIPGDITAAGFYGDVNVPSGAPRFRIDNFSVGTSEMFIEPAYFQGPSSILLTPGFRWTRIGFIYDDRFPFVYSFGLDTWIHVFPLEDEEELYVFYNYADGNFYWTGNAFYPEVFPVATGQQ